jgi:hypothetical protein
LIVESGLSSNGSTQDSTTISLCRNGIVKSSYRSGISTDCKKSSTSIVQTVLPAGGAPAVMEAFPPPPIAYVLCIVQFVTLSEPETDDKTMVEFGLIVTSTVKPFL